MKCKMKTKFYVSIPELGQLKCLLCEPVGCSMPARCELRSPRTHLGPARVWNGMEWHGCGVCQPLSIPGRPLCEAVALRLRRQKRAQSWTAAETVVQRAGLRSAHPGSSKSCGTEFLCTWAPGRPGSWQVTIGLCQRYDARRSS